MPTMGVEATGRERGGGVGIGDDAEVCDSPTLEEGRSQAANCVVEVSGAPGGARPLPTS